MSEKVTGYLLLVVGLAIMVISVINIFLVFTNRVKPFSVFNLASSSSSSALNINDIISQIQKNNPDALNQSIAPPKLDILPPEVLNQTLNMTTHFFLMSFILGFGYKLASLGVSLIRPINVKLKSHVLEAVNSNDKGANNNVLPDQLLPQTPFTKPPPPSQDVQPTKI